jgi:hypothetical protein
MCANWLTVGCQSHSFERFMGFSDAQVLAMANDALKWWTTWKPVLQSVHAAMFAGK